MNSTTIHIYYDYDKEIAKYKKLRIRKCILYPLIIIGIKIKINENYSFDQNNHFQTSLKKKIHIHGEII